MFDCFGVIITDSLKVVVEELEVRDHKAAQEVVEIIRANNRGLITPAESNQQIAEVLGVTVEAWRKRIDAGEVKDARLLAYIRELRKSYKTALLSNIGRESLNRRFSKEELKMHFDTVVISGDLGLVKPEPEIYLQGAKMLDVAPGECVMLDDRERHCDGARAVGMQAILYQDFVQAREELGRLLAG